MRTILAVAVALCLSGCADSDFFGESSSSSAPAASAPAPSADTAQSAPVSAAAEAQPVAPLAGAPEPAAPAPQQIASPAAGPHCTQIATLRARDAAYAGEDTETQESVYNRTYAECMAWDAKHRS